MGAPLGDYPDSAGAHKVSVFYHNGPSSYTRLTTSPLAAGDTVRVAEAGIKTFDYVHSVGFSDSGLYTVAGVAPVGNPSNNKQAARATSWKLKWTVVATGVEVANSFDLSGERVRMWALGRY